MRPAEVQPGNSMPPGTPEHGSEGGGQTHWLSRLEFQGIACLTDTGANKVLRQAHKDASKRIWRGSTLVVRDVSTVGGASGKAYEVRADTLPPALLAIWKASQPRQQAYAVAIKGPEMNALPEDPANQIEQVAKARYRLEIIRAALNFPEGSQKRSIELERAASKEWKNPKTGKTERYSKRTLYDWIKKLEKDGAAGLKDQARDRGLHQVLVSRSWDKAWPLAPETKEDIARRLEAHVRSLWRQDVNGWRECSRKASTWLMQACH